VQMKHQDQLTEEAWQKIHKAVQERDELHREMQKGALTLRQLDCCNPQELETELRKVKAHIESDKSDHEKKVLSLERDVAIKEQS